MAETPNLEPEDSVWSSPTTSRRVPVMSYLTSLGLHLLILQNRHSWRVYSDSHTRGNMLLHARVHVQACLILPASSSQPTCVTDRSPGACTPGSRNLITVTTDCCHTRLLFKEAAPAASAPAQTVPGSGPTWPTENSFTS